MLIEQKKLWFRTAQIFFDDARAQSALSSREFDALTILSYSDIIFPDTRVRSKETAIVDVALEAEQILRNCNDTTRNEIRKTMRDTSFSVVSTSECFDELYDLYAAFEYEQGRVPFGKKVLKQCNGVGIRHDGRLLAGVFAYPTKPILRVFAIFSLRLHADDHELYKTISYASRRAMWELFLHARERGCTGVDLASVNTKNPETRSIAQYKMGFGGQIVTEYTYTYRTKMYQCFEHAMTGLIFLKRQLHRIF